MKGLKNKNVLVTGSSVGIGQAIAIRFAQEGCNVAINYNRTKEGALKTKQEVDQYGVKSIVVQADVSNEDDCKRMVETTIEKLGSLDILINNAAIQKNIPSHERSLKDHEQVIGVNLTGPFVLAREAITHFLERKYKGVIINISSPHEIIPKPGFLSYSMSKGGLGNLTKTLALEYARNGIRVNSVAPGATLTRINSAWKDDPEERKKVEANIPLGWAAEPEEIAPSVAFLASEEAGYVTGITMYVDGGAVLYPSYMKNWSS